MAEIPIKICHLTSVHPIEDDRIFIKECAGMAANGFDVTLIAFGKMESEYVRHGVKLRTLFFPVRNRLQRITRRPGILFREALQINADIYHFHDPELLPVGLKLRKKGKKVVYDAHEDLPRQMLQKDWIPIPLRKLFSVVIEAIENYYVKRLNAVVTVTQYIAKRFSKISPKVVVCANYASINEFGEVPEWGDQRNSVCYLGGISEIRGILEVTEAARKTGVPLELAGIFDSETLEARINNNEIVNFRGFVDRKEIKTIMSRSFAGMVTLYPAPNIEHSLPIKMFEYMASGLPVIASDFDDWKPIVEGNDAGICVNPSNADSIAAAILKLKNNPSIAKKMGLNGRKAVEEKYNWQKEETKLISLYKEL